MAPFTLLTNQFSASACITLDPLIKIIFTSDNQRQRAMFKGVKITVKIWVAFLYSNTLHINDIPPPPCNTPTLPQLHFINYGLAKYFHHACNIKTREQLQLLTLSLLLCAIGAARMDTIPVVFIPLFS